MGHTGSPIRRKWERGRNAERNADTRPATAWRTTDRFYRVQRTEVREYRVAATAVPREWHSDEWPWDGHLTTDRERSRLSRWKGRPRPVYRVYRARVIPTWLAYPADYDGRRSWNGTQLRSERSKYAIVHWQRNGRGKEAMKKRQERRERRREIEREGRRTAPRERVARVSAAGELCPLFLTFTASYFPYHTCDVC